MKLTFDLKPAPYIITADYQHPEDTIPTAVTVQYNGRDVADISHEQQCKDIATGLRRRREGIEGIREATKQALKRDGIELDDYKKKPLGQMELRDFTPEEMKEKPELVQRLKEYYALVVEARQCLYMASQLKTDDLPYTLIDPQTVHVTTDKHVYHISTNITPEEARAWVEQRTKTYPQLSGLGAEALCRTHNSLQMSDAVTRVRAGKPRGAPLVRLTHLKIDADPINYFKNNQQLLSACIDLDKAFKDHRSQETIRSNSNWVVGTDPYKAWNEALLEPSFVELGWAAGVVSNARLLNSPKDYFDDEIRKASGL